MFTAAVGTSFTSDKLLTTCNEDPEVETPRFVLAAAASVKSAKLAFFCNEVPATAAAAPMASKSVVAATAAVPNPRLVLATASSVSSDKLFAATISPEPKLPDNAK